MPLLLGFEASTETLIVSPMYTGRYGSTTTMDGLAGLGVGWVGGAERTRGAAWEVATGLALQ